MSRLTSRVSLNVVLAYEDFPTGLHALRTFELLFLESNQCPNFDTQNLWKFDLLGISKLREIAVIEAANADLVIISAHGLGELPPPVKQWMDGWVNARQPGPGALVAMLDGAGWESASRFAMEPYLEDCALRAGMDYFIQKVQGRHLLDQSDSAADTKSDWRAFEILTETGPDSCRIPRPQPRN